LLTLLSHHYISLICYQVLSLDTLYQFTSLCTIRCILLLRPLLLLPHVDVP
jgi:hypothetical protein